MASGWVCKYSGPNPEQGLREGGSVYIPTPTNSASGLAPRRETGVPGPTQEEGCTSLVSVEGHVPPLEKGENISPGETETKGSSGEMGMGEGGQEQPQGLAGAGRGLLPHSPPRDGLIDPLLKGWKCHSPEQRGAKFLLSLNCWGCKETARWAPTVCAV